MKEDRRLRVFENRVLRRIFGPRRNEVTGKRRKLLNEELNDVYCYPNIIRAIKSRRMRSVVHVARMGRIQVHVGIWWGFLRERYHFEDPVVDGRITLRWIFRKWDLVVWAGSIWLRIGTGGGYL